MAIILLILTAAGPIVGSVRLDWSQADLSITLSVVGQLLTIGILIGSAIQCGRKQPDRLR